jgi:hypothetical protein
LPTLVVAGDVTLDWNVADMSPSSTTGTWSGELHASISFEPGGACMLAALAAAAIDADVRTVPGGAVPRPDDRRFHHSTAAWAQFPVARGSGEFVWRVNDYLGLARRDDAAPVVGEWSQVHDDPAEADIVLLADGGLGFSEDRRLWPRSIREPGDSGPPIVVLKTDDPFGRSALFHHLVDLQLLRLVVVTTVANLRRSGIEVSRGLSWEASAEDVARALASGNALAPLAEAAEVVVSFGAAGALVTGRGSGGDLDAELVFDSREMEATWEAARPGGMIGATTCMTVGVSSALVASDAGGTLVDGIRRGLTAGRVLHETGFVPAEPGSTAIRFPTEAVATAISGPPLDFAETVVPPCGGPKQPWVILREHYVDGFDDLAHRIVRLGPERALAGMPLGRFGAMVTADRREIEEFRSIQNLIAEYCAIPLPPRPLSIAVFGPPGSGKSFAVTQVARSLHAGDVEKLTFNLSQLEATNGLIAAFHRVRDAGLSAHVPLVFWDEFDTALRTEPLGWLRHFLAPMQDGEFLDGEVAHPIGRAVFVFAGGTAQRIDDLGKDLGRTEEDRAARFRSVKGPDFLSRLRGAVEILGPDPCTSDPAEDPEHVIRRAIVLQSLLVRTWPQLCQFGPDGSPELAVDVAVAEAFLGVRRYRHGVRSMESIVASSRLVGERRYLRSALPPAGQLRLHVNDEEFLALARRGPA